MEDDDDFGDLYADVLRPLPSAAPLPPTELVPDFSIKEDSMICTGSSTAGPCAPSLTSSISAQLVDSGIEDAGGDDDWMLGEAHADVDEHENWDDDEDPFRTLAQPGKDIVLDFGPSGLEDEEDTAHRVLDSPKKFVDDTEVVGDIDPDPVIPGLSAGPTAISSAADGANARPSRIDNWDSDSEDDLQIVLNNDEHGPLGGEMGGRMRVGEDDDDDDDGEEDLVIVTDEDQLHHPHVQGMEEKDWTEDGTQSLADGERKDAADGKGGGAVGGLLGARIGYSNHGFHAQHHSPFKYLRPGAAPQAGGSMTTSISGSGPVRPPPGTIPFAGRGRGDWRPAAGRGLSNLQKGFHTGYGLPAWSGGPSGRGFGGGLDFTLPSHKTVFDIDIDGFEEKPWRHPGVDISDFFNFGLDEDNWKNYCKKLDQLRLESTMQSKINVYESGRSEHEYDPDLPPELSAASALHDSENAARGRSDGGSLDLDAQGRVIRQTIPIGRAIQVETGNGERMPSIDTRPPRMRDSDAIIEIFCQDSSNDSDVHVGVFEQSGHINSLEFVKHICEAEDSDHFNRSHYPRHNSSSMIDFTTGIKPERVGLPSTSGSPLENFLHAKPQILTHPSEPFGANHGERSTQRSMHGRHSSSSVNHSKDKDQNVLVNGHDGSDENLDNNTTNQLDDGATDHRMGHASPAMGVESTREQSPDKPEHEYELDDRLALGDSAELETEGEDIVSDSRISHGTADDEGSLIHSVKKQKLSLVEHHGVDYVHEGENLRKTFTNNSRAKLGSGMEFPKWPDSEEVTQDGQSRRSSDTRKRHDDKHYFSRKDDRPRNGRQVEERNRSSSKENVDFRHSYVHKEPDSVPVRPSQDQNEVFERPKDRDVSMGVRQRKEDDIHGGRRAKEVEPRRDRAEEAGSRHRNKDRSDRKDKDEEIPPKKRLDNGDLRGHEREGGSRRRERGDYSMSRRENLDDLRAKKRKDEEYLRKEKADKYREDINEKKRSGSVDLRRREDVSRSREKILDHRSGHHKSDNHHQEEREDRHNSKPSREDSQKQRLKDDVRGSLRNGRVMEEKSTIMRTGSESKGVGSEKGHQQRERRQHNESSRRGDRDVEEDDKNKGHNETHRASKNTRTEKSLAKEHPRKPSDGQHKYKDGHGEDNRKGPDADGSDQQFFGPNGRIDGQTARRSEKVVIGDIGEKENADMAIYASNERTGLLDLNEQIETPRPNLSFGEGMEGEPVSDDDNQEESRRGRSKLERWTSHKERDYVAWDELPPPPPPPPPPLPEDSNVGDLIQRTDEDRDRHLETVAKLKRRSERFNLPMPGEKDDITSGKKAEETRQIRVESPSNPDVKPERPARKRKWRPGG